MDIKITPAKLRGSIQAVSSKAYAHRLFLASALSNTPTKISLKNSSADLIATFEVLKNFSFRYSQTGSEYTVTPINFSALPEKLSVDVRDSAPTLRFLLPIISTLSDQVTYDGDGKILLRSYADILYVLKGVGFSSEKLPFTVRGRLKAGQYRIPQKVSMQFVSGLIFALCLLEEDSQIIFMDSISTVNTDMTVQVLSLFGVNVEKTENGYFIKGGQKFLSPNFVSVEGDYALSCVWKLANRLGASISVENLCPNTLQSEKEYFDYIDQLFDGDGNIDNLPNELLPLMAVGSCLLDRKTNIKLLTPPQGKELIKVNATILALNKLGGEVVGNEQGVTINGKGKLEGGQIIDCFGDFRLAMALSIAGCFADKPIKILDAQCVQKQYATFYNDLNSLGGNATVE